MIKKINKIRKEKTFSYIKEFDFYIGYFENRIENKKEDIFLQKKNKLQKDL